MNLLINWVYFPAVGHVIEAFKYANAFLTNNEDLKISILLNAETAYELDKCFPEIKTIPIDLYRFNNEFFNFEEYFKSLFKSKWDYFFTDPRVYEKTINNNLNFYNIAIIKYVNSNVINNRYDLSNFPDFSPKALRFKIPSASLKFANSYINQNKSPRISILVSGGSNSRRSPELKFWDVLFEKINEKYVNSEIILIGNMNISQCYTRNIKTRDIQYFLKKYPNIKDAFDLNIIDQLAIISKCDLHISPHTGMSFAAQCVGVPWLVISGSEFYEYLLNGVPFISIYPNCENYPCYNRSRSNCMNFNNISDVVDCMKYENLKLKYDEIIVEMELLLNKNYNYLDCVQKHLKYLNNIKIKNNIDYSIHDYPSSISSDYNF